MSKKAAPKWEPKPDDPEQYRRFIETAKEVDADNDPQAFDRAFKKVAKEKPHSA